MTEGGGGEGAQAVGGGGVGMGAIPSPSACANSTQPAAVSAPTAVGEGVLLILLYRRVFSCGPACVRRGFCIDLAEPVAVAAFETSVSVV